MLPIYDMNGLVLWDEQEIRERDRLTAEFAFEVERILRSINRAWLFRRVEAPTLTPRALINDNYTSDDVWSQTTDDLVLRPETTMGSYYAAKMMLKEKSGLLPLCVWQAGKSYRREQDKSLSKMRLKEFYQQEFQCLYSKTTKADYQSMTLPFLAEAIGRVVACQTRVVPSDRQPDYSLSTMDIEAYTLKGFMELCSVSVRKDYSEDIMVLEIAIGLDRCVRLKTLEGALHA